MVQSDPAEDLLKSFLEYVQLEDCADALRQHMKITRFDQLKDISEEGLKSLIGSPATKRFMDKYKKYKVKARNPKPSRMLPMTEFLTKLNLQSVEENLKGSLHITRLEHFAYATVEELAEVMEEASARQIRMAYKKEKRELKFGKFSCFPTSLMGSLAHMTKTALEHLLNTKVDKDIGLEAKIELKEEKKPTRKPSSSSEDNESDTHSHASECGEVTVELERVNQKPAPPLPQQEEESYQSTETPEDIAPTSTDPSAPPASLVANSNPPSPVPSVSTTSTSRTSVGGDWEIVGSEEEQVVEEKEDEMPDPKLVPPETLYETPDFFEIARGKDAWQTISEATITKDQINEVKRYPNAEGYSEEDVCEALHFVVMQQKDEPFYFERSPPERIFRTFTMWHTTTAAKMIILRHLYGIATQCSLHQCFEVLSRCDWQLFEALQELIV